MRWPLDEVTINTGGDFGVVAVPGTGLKDATGVSRHIGIDLRARTPQPVKAPADGSIIRTFTGSTGNKISECLINGQVWRFLHLSKFTKTSGNFKEGDTLCWTGNTGGVQPHLHFDIRRAGTAWNASFYNYFDPKNIIIGGTMYGGKSAKEWHDMYYATLGVAEARGRNCAKMWNAGGVDPSSVTNEDQAGNQVVANIDAKNKRIMELEAAGEFVPLTEPTYVKRKK